jgi:photosystem II stability/assembly factor-like uncharacterized protein
MLFFPVSFLLHSRGGLFTCSFRTGLGLLFAFVFYTMHAQHLELIHSGTQADDSSYYDIYRAQDGYFMLGGKFGVLKTLHEDGTIHDVEYPRGGESILRIQEFYKGSFILAADAGIVYRMQNNQWSTIALEKYKRFCFYDVTIIDSSTALMCGGKSEIAYGKRVIPYGFVLRTEDGGATWKRVYRKWNRMVWKVLYDRNDRKSYMLTYSPFGSRVMESGDAGRTWKRSAIRSSSLWHDMEINSDHQLVFCGGKSGNLKRKEGHIVYKDTPVTGKCKVSTRVLDSGMIWDYHATDNFEIASGSRGTLFVKEKGLQAEWKRIEVKPAVNLYEISFIDTHSAYIVGSNKTLYKLIIQDAPVNGL